MGIIISKKEFEIVLAQEADAGANSDNKDNDPASKSKTLSTDNLRLEHSYVIKLMELFGENLHILIVTIPTVVVSTVFINVYPFINCTIHVHTERFQYPPMIDYMSLCLMIQNAGNGRELSDQASDLIAVLWHIFQIKSM